MMPAVPKGTKRAKKRGTRPAMPKGTKRAEKWDGMKP